MPSLSTTAPPEGKYRAVLQLPGLDAIPGVTHPVRFIHYDENRQSVGVKLPGQPMRHTLFLSKRNAIDRAVREGWVDVTKQWQQHLLDQRPKVSTPSQLALYNALTDSWQSKKQLVDASGIADSEWRTSIRLMEERGLVELNYGPRQRRTASNRTFRYRKGPRWDDALSVVEV